MLCKCRNTNVKVLIVWCCTIRTFTFVLSSNKTASFQCWPYYKKCKKGGIPLFHIFDWAIDGARSRDLRLGKPTLYQLSYYRNCAANIKKMAQKGLSPLCHFFYSTSRVTMLAAGISRIRSPVFLSIRALSKSASLILSGFSNVL